MALEPKTDHNIALEIAAKKLFKSRLKKYPEGHLKSDRSSETLSFRVQKIFRQPPTRTDLEPLPPSASLPNKEAIARPYNVQRLGRFPSPEQQ